MLAGKVRILQAISSPSIWRSIKGISKMCVLSSLLYPEGAVVVPSCCSNLSSTIRKPTSFTAPERIDGRWNEATIKADTWSSYFFVPHLILLVPNIVIIVF